MTLSVKVHEFRGEHRVKRRMDIQKVQEMVKIILPHKQHVESSVPLSTKRDIELLKIKINKHNAELQRADPGTKVEGSFSTRGHIFPHDAQNGFSLFSSF